MKKFTLFFAALFCMAAVSAKTIYFVPNSNWSQADAKFAIWHEAQPQGWSAFLQKVDGTADVYSVDVDDAWTKVKFVRFSPNATETGWFWEEPNILTWNVTGEQTIPSDNNQFTLAADTWSDGGGTWSAYTAPTPEPEGIVYDLGGGKIVVATNADLWELIMPYYNDMYSDAPRGRTDISVCTGNQVGTFFNGKGKDIFTLETSEYKWLGDYMASKYPEYLTASLAEVYWRHESQGFFQCTDGNDATSCGHRPNYTKQDWTVYGQPESWLPAYKANANLSLPTKTVWGSISWAFTLPALEKEGYDFKGWKDADGNTVTKIPAKTTKAHYVAQWAAKETTALENAEVAVSARKVVENGQIVIIKDGVRYNVLGTVIR